MQVVSPYKTAAELGISDWERDGLIALIGPMERGELKLDMNWAESGCGTFRCIGGWIAHFAGKNSYDYVNSFGKNSYCQNSPLAALFWPREDLSKGDRLLPVINCRDGSIGAQAILNFLILGDPMWSDIMSAA